MKEQAIGHLNPTVPGEEDGDRQPGSEPKRPF
jgi:hypothetical protein